ncbi:hypothetical protein ENBRE01_1710 [Enteropsectra breve]|nr:hypothetical protein ENBRE01_1710 [Enteropsectra breve]
MVPTDNIEPDPTDNVEPDLKYDIEPNLKYDIEPDLKYDIVKYPYAICSKQGIMLFRAEPTHHIQKKNKKKKVLVQESSSSEKESKERKESDAHSSETKNMPQNCSKYEFRFSEGLCASKVYSTQIQNRNSYIEIDIKNNVPEIISSTNVLHEFNTPADFYIDKDAKSIEFYKNMLDKICGDDLDALMNYADELNYCLKKEKTPKTEDKYLDTLIPDDEEHHNDIQIAPENQILKDTKRFPLLPQPRAMVFAHFETFANMDKTKNLQKTESLNAHQLTYGEPIPEEEPHGALDLLLKRHGQKSFEVQKEFFSEFLKDNKIFKVSELEASYNRLGKRKRSLLTKYALKQWLVLHAYCYSKGPWRLMWVQLGYDPSIDRDNYRHQEIFVPSLKIRYLIRDSKAVTDEVDKNMDWYLFKECHKTDGFVSQALKDLVAYILETQKISTAK